VVGKAGNHLQMMVRQGREHRKAIAFNRGDQAEQVNEVRRLRLAFEPIINEWNGRRSVELKVVDWKFGDVR
jgi:single-stranded-DNA-specific exonuclease